MESYRETMVSGPHVNERFMFICVERLALFSLCNALEPFNQNTHHQNLYKGLARNDECCLR